MPRALCKPRRTSSSRDSIGSRTSCKHKANGLVMSSLPSWTQFGTRLSKKHLTSNAQRRTPLSLMFDVQHRRVRSFAKAGWTFASAPPSAIFSVRMNLLINILLVLYVLVALLMMLVILMQRPKSEGLGAAFGGGVTENIFGAQTTNVLVKFTAWLAGIFFFLTFALSILYAHRSMSDNGLRRELLKQQTGAAV